MFYWLADLPFLHSFFNVFRYITFRSAGALMTAFLVVWLGCPAFIRWMKRLSHEGQPIRCDGPQNHLITKKGTPTMGGFLILSAFFFSVLLWTDLCSLYVWPILFLIGGFGILGGIDDFFKIKYQNSKGISASLKFFGQIGIAAFCIFWLEWIQPPSLHAFLFFPFFKGVSLYLGIFFPIFAIFVIVGSSNAVNLTDGLDGLAIGPVMITFSVLGIIAYVTGHCVFATYLKMPFILQSGEIAVMCCAMVGACLGFLWYNSPPAMIFMGDMGSLSLGALIGFIGVILKQEFVVAMVGGIFVLEALSVMIQVISFKTTGKRVFLMAPIHHHFEKKGWSESTVVFRFWIISLLLGLFALATLKLR